MPTKTVSQAPADPCYLTRCAAQDAEAWRSRCAVALAAGRRVDADVAAGRARGCADAAAREAAAVPLATRADARALADEASASATAAEIDCARARARVFARGRLLRLAMTRRGQ